MSLFRCRGCEARDKEIQHLLAELAQQRDHTQAVARQLCEVMAPGSSQRAAAAPRPVVEGPPMPRPRKITFPGYERPPSDDSTEIS